MKRRAALTAIVLVIVMLFTQLAFAGELEIIGTSPKNGEKDRQAVNFAFKIEFSEDMSDPANDNVNRTRIVLKSTGGMVYSYTIQHHEKTPNELWLVLDDMLESNTEYEVVVGEGIKSNNGSILTEAKTFTFKTRDAAKDSTVSAFLSIGMFAIMIIASMRGAKKSNDSNDKQPKKIEKIVTDPYKLAKANGISVDEAKALIAKEQAKQDKKNAASAKAREKKAAEDARFEAAVEKRVKELHDASVYKVKFSGSMKAHGKDLPKAIQKKINAKNKKKK